jgi:hypothetical protein
VSDTARAGAAIEPDMPFERDTIVPLTDEQRRMLRLNRILPVMVIAPMMLFAGTFLVLLSRSRVFGHPLVKAMILLMTLMLLAVIGAVFVHVRNHARDLRRGTAESRARRLIAKKESGRSPKSFQAEFEDLGNLLVMYDTYLGIVPGGTYRVIFSPATRRAWSVERVTSERS